MYLYENNGVYTVHFYENREQWLKKRVVGIGGSDASTLVGLNPYKSNLDLWLEKKGKKVNDFKGNELTEYGNNAEPILRALYKLKSKYDVQYQGNVILQSNDVEWLLYSPDGLLHNEETKENGILEIKTTLIQNISMLEQWKNQVPMHYYIQVLHGLLVTGFDFVVFQTELRFAWHDNVEIRTYEFRRDEVLEDLEWLLEEEKKAYQYYVDDVQPPKKIIL